MTAALRRSPLRDRCSLSKQLPLLALLVLLIVSVDCEADIVGNVDEDPKLSGGFESGEVDLQQEDEEFELRHRIRTTLMDTQQGLIAERLACDDQDDPAGETSESRADDSAQAQSPTETEQTSKVVQPLTTKDSTVGAASRDDVAEELDEGLMNNEPEVTTSQPPLSELPKSSEDQVENKGQDQDQDQEQDQDQDQEQDQDQDQDQDQEQDQEQEQELEQQQQQEEDEEQQQQQQQHEQVQKQTQDQEQDQDQEQEQEQEQAQEQYQYQDQYQDQQQDQQQDQDEDQSQTQTQARDQVQNHEQEQVSSPRDSTDRAPTQQRRTLSHLAKEAFSMLLTRAFSSKPDPDAPSTQSEEHVVVPAKVEDPAVDNGAASLTVGEPIDNVDTSINVDDTADSSLQHHDAPMLQGADQVSPTYKEEFDEGYEVDVETETWADEETEYPTRVDDYDPPLSHDAYATDDTTTLDQVFDEEEQHTNLPTAENDQDQDQDQDQQHDQHQQEDQDQDQQQQQYEQFVEYLVGVGKTMLQAEPIRSSAVSVGIGVLGVLVSFLLCCRKKTDVADVSQPSTLTQRLKKSKSDNTESCDWLNNFFTLSPPDFINHQMQESFLALLENALKKAARSGLGNGKTISLKYLSIQGSVLPQISKIKCSLDDDDKSKQLDFYFKFQPHRGDIHLVFNCDYHSNRSAEVIKLEIMEVKGYASLKFTSVFDARGVKSQPVGTLSFSQQPKIKTTIQGTSKRTKIKEFLDNVLASLILHPAGLQWVVASDSSGLAKRVGQSRSRSGTPSGLGELRSTRLPTPRGQQPSYKQQNDGGWSGTLSIHFGSIENIPSYVRHPGVKLFVDTPTQPFQEISTSDPASNFDFDTDLSLEVSGATVSLTIQLWNQDKIVPSLVAEVNILIATLSMKKWVEHEHKLSYPIGQPTRGGAPATSDMRVRFRCCLSDGASITDPFANNNNNNNTTNYNNNTNNKNNTSNNNTNKLTPHWRSQDINRQPLSEDRSDITHPPTHTHSSHTHNSVSPGRMLGYSRSSNNNTTNNNNNNNNNNNHNSNNDINNRSYNNNTASRYEDDGNNTADDVDEHGFPVFEYAPITAARLQTLNPNVHRSRSVASSTTRPRSRFRDDQSEISQGVQSNASHTSRLSNESNGSSFSKKFTKTRSLYKKIFKSTSGSSLKGERRTFVHDQDDNGDRFDTRGYNGVERLRPLSENGHDLASRASSRRSNRSRSFGEI